VWRRRKGVERERKGCWCFLHKGKREEEEEHAGLL
jgi:hypothetical protein